MACQIDTILYDIGVEDLEWYKNAHKKRNPTRGWFAGRALVDHGIAPELAGKIAECYHKGIGVAVDPYEAMRYLTIYYQIKDELEDERLRISQALINEMALKSRRDPRLSRALNGIEFYNDFFSWASAVPDVADAVLALYPLDDLITLCSRLGVASIVGYGVQFAMTISMVAHDLWLQRKNFAKYGFFKVLYDTFLKDDRWSRLCDAILWLVLPIIILTVSAPQLEMILFVFGSALNTLTVLLGGIKACVEMQKEINIMKQRLEEVKQQIQEESETATPIELLKLEEQVTHLEDAIKDAEKARPKFIVENLFSAAMTCIYLVGAVAFFSEPVTGCAIMAGALLIGFLVSTYQWYRDAKATKFTPPKELQQDFRLFGCLDRRRAKNQTEDRSCPDPEYPLLTMQ